MPPTLLRKSLCGYLRGRRAASRPATGGGLLSQTAAPSMPGCAARDSGSGTGPAARRRITRPDASGTDPVAVAEALSQPQREHPSRYGGSEHGQSPISGVQGGGARGFRPHLMWRALAQCFPPISTDIATRSRKCIAEALRQPQREHPSRYSVSRREERPAMAIRGGGGRGFRPHLMRRALMWCFLPILDNFVTEHRKCTVEALRQPQHERPNRYGGSGHGQSPISGVQGGGARGFRPHLMWRALAQCFPPISTDTATWSRKCISSY